MNQPVLLTIDTDDLDNLLELHQEAETHWEAVWETARDWDNEGAVRRSAHWIALHRWAMFTLNNAKEQR